ncbi:Gfo/Idh/MocA family oxidoreductase [Flavihumibacter sp. CACIAM 22H1]|uniref:Gfo/Idh/MocA family protein n=1 Tax=Flavihumibacter sp. CACIAM 22H1 TaxID=1812911 RepID=UPI0007A863FF|nr:Gfo/Idh/MocA family oxidoreductase [Flavihumibacter sp. CACIAM 22H1]KYP15162.1 MAG: oxidoreductase [Flavihumibacter sp. CACIAM 22H1]
MRLLLLIAGFLAVCTQTPAQTGNQAAKLDIIVVGMTHDHVHGILQYYKQNRVTITGIVETNQALIERFMKSYQLPSSLFFNSLTAAIKNRKPDAVLAFNAIDEHLAVAETCLPLRIPVMVEKPLATTLKDALRMEALSKQYKTPVLTNYETTWYNSNHYAKLQVEQGALGTIRKMVVHSGHEGPQEIGCSKEFLAWLTDPVKNGGGASRDFGCYGANLMTWLMQGKAPKSVTAVIQHYKPAVYPKVDDVATILLEYETATGVIEASWNWPYSIKDLEIFGSSAYLHAVDAQTVLQKKEASKPITGTAPATIYGDYISYLEAYLDGKITDTHDLSSLSNNLLVVKILEAATRSAKEGRKIQLD